MADYGGYADPTLTDEEKKRRAALYDPQSTNAGPPTAAPPPQPANPITSPSDAVHTPDQTLGRYYNGATARAEDVASLRMGRDATLNAYNNYQNRIAPQAAAPVAALPVAAAQTTVGPAATVTTPDVGPAAGATAARVDTTQADELRARQLALYDRYRGVEEGTAPSVAAQQMQRGNEEAIRSQMALAGTQHGYASGSAIRNAQRNVAALQQQNVLQQGIVRAQEAAAAREGEAQLATGTRQQDIGVATTNAGNEQQTTLNRADATDRLNALQAQIKLQGGIANAEQQNEITKLQAQLTQQTNITNAQEANLSERFNVDAQTKVALANLDARLRQQGYDDAQRRDMLEAWLREQGYTNDWNKTTYEVDAKGKVTGKDLLETAGKGAAVAATGGAAASDRSEKTGVAKVSPKDQADFLDSLADAYSYRYKDANAPGAAPGEHYGPMADDLEKSKIGKTLVFVGPDGKKMIDTGRLALALASAVADRKRKAA